MASSDFTQPVCLFGVNYPTKPFNDWDGLDSHPLVPILVTVSGATPAFNSSRQIPDITTSTTITNSIFSPIIQKMGFDNQNQNQNKLYVGGFDIDITENMLREIFKAFGPISNIDIHLPRTPAPGSYDTNSTTQSAFAFVIYDRIDAVFDALSCMSQYRIRGKNLKISLPQSTKQQYGSFLPDYRQYELHVRQPEMIQKWIRSVDNGLKSYALTQNEHNSLLDLFGSPDAIQNNGINGINDDGNNNINNNGISGGSINPNYLNSQNKIYVGGNFPSTIQEHELEMIFSPFGKILKITLIRGPDGRHKGYGFIEFDDETSVQKALVMNGQDLGGKKLTVSTAKVTDSRNNPNNDGNSKGNDDNLLNIQNQNEFGSELNSKKNYEFNSIGEAGGGKNQFFNGIKLVPFEFDYNNITIPDPLVSRYPGILPTKQEIVVYSCVKIKNLIDKDEWIAMPQSSTSISINNNNNNNLIDQGNNNDNEQNPFFQNQNQNNQNQIDLQNPFFFQNFTDLQKTTITPKITPITTRDEFISKLIRDFAVFGVVSIADSIMIVDPDDDYCTFFIKFQSPIVAKRCVTVLNNRYFFGRPIMATYCLGLPPSPPPLPLSPQSHPLELLPPAPAGGGGGIGEIGTAQENDEGYRHVSHQTTLPPTITTTTILPTEANTMGSSNSMPIDICNPFFTAITRELIDNLLLPPKKK